jgi:tRNA-2-methylthio-N6-dimethylallyladenosine synthase
MPFEKPHPGYAIWTVGCQMNEADARTVATHLEAAGFRPVPEAEADLVVVTSCVVRQQAEDKVLGRLRHLEAEKRRRPALRIALMGCLVGMGSGGELPGRFPFVDVFLPPSEPQPLLDWLALEGLAPMSRMRAIAPAGCGLDAATLPPSQRGAVSVHVPAVLGCSHACAYCIIPQRRGRERSRPRAGILDEARRLAAEGVREIVLLGQIVDRYGRDLDPPLDLADLLRDVAALEGLDRVRFLTSHPSYFPRSVLDAVAECPRICPHFVLPIQAGHDEVLARMRRGYTVDDYRRLIGGIRERLPEAAIHTDLIVGFPGETESQFEETARRVEEFRFDKIHLAKYSPRPGTYAARRYPDDVPAADKERRRLRIEGLQCGIQEITNRRHADRTVEVLIEEADARRPGRWRGRTPDDRLVIVESPESLKGRLTRVRIHWTGPFTLLGKPEPHQGSFPERNGIRLTGGEESADRPEPG